MVQEGSVMDNLDYEKTFWGDCCNTLGEELKQLEYASCMGIDFATINKNVVDIGGGPVSMLLKCNNRGPNCAVVDPIVWPQWVQERYEAAHIGLFITEAERFTVAVKYDEVWIYNVLQHVVDPALVIEVAKNCAPVLRIFEWVDIAPYKGHPHLLEQCKLLQWIKWDGWNKTFLFTGAHGCYGRAFFGVFEHG
jgi:hypothetical protein